jgi:predicted ATPase/DNA-binding CsgD family transcriptional regulator
VVGSALCSLRVPNTCGAALYGRAIELADIRRLLEQDGVRLLTLTGPGGTGKTRLAEVIADEACASAWDRVCFVDLTAVAEPAAVPAAIAGALGVQEAGSAPLRAIVRDVIGPDAVLLVLDNFERVLDAASFVAHLLADVPRLACLVTSREPLHLRSERLYQVQPLPVPGPDVTDLETIRDAPSVALFVDRGQARWHSFALTLDNARAVVEICRRLDGLPLAIELAAAQIGVLSPEAVLARLESAEPFIVNGARDLPARHRTLSTTVTWSYDLLEPSEQLEFRCCGVFNGSFSAEALAAVVGSVNADTALVTLAQLADKNLVRIAEPAAQQPRFRLLETIRSFALDRLTSCNELASARSTHAAYFLELAENAEQSLIGPTMADTLDRLDREYDNFRAVLSWSLETGNTELGLRLAGALNRFWMMRGHLSDARHWFERALPRSAIAPAEVLAKALNTAGVLAGLQGDNAAAEPYFRESYQLWEKLNNPIRMAAAMGNLGLVAQERQDTALALECFTQAEALYAASGDRRGVAVSIGSRAHLARQQGQTLEAVPLFERTLEVFREVGDPNGIANSLANLGHAMTALGRADAATAALVEALELRRTLGNTLAVAECLEGLAAAAAAKRLGRRGARLLGAADALREVTGAPLAHAERHDYDATMRKIQELLTPADFAMEHAIGRDMSVEQAVEFAVQNDEARALPSLSGLTARERQVATLVARGLTNAQIAHSLSVSRRTVSTHLEHTFAKLNIQSRAELAAWIARQENSMPRA